MNERRSLLSWIFGLCVYLLGIAFLAGVVHIVSVLAMPRLAPRDAFARIAAVAPLGKMTLMDPVAPKSPVFPFEDPATELGVCRYDLSQGPLQILADLQPERMMLFSFHSRFDDVFYSMSDRVASRGRLDVLVLTSDQLNAVEANDTDEDGPKEQRIVSPSMQGFLLVRSFAAQPDDHAAARDAIAAIGCTITQAPQS